MKQNDTLNTLLDRGYEGAINFGSNGEISSISFWMPHDELETSEEAIPVSELKSVIGQLDTDEAEVVQKIINWWMFIRRHEVNDSH